jgi:hypothetical protein
MHYEVELGLVIGKTVRDLDPEDHKTALDSIASMSIFPIPEISIVHTKINRLRPRHRHDRAQRTRRS